MASTKIQMIGLILALIAYVGTIVICGLPAWKVSAFIGSNIVIAQVYWEGLWTTCVVESTGQMQCEAYFSLLALPQDVQASRALVVIALVIGFFGIILVTVGGKCTNFAQNEVTKARIIIASGVLFIITGFLVLVPVCWTTNTVVNDFYNPTLLDAQKRELGACIYVGWGCSGLFFLGGGLLCSSCPPKDDTQGPIYNVKYSQAKSVDSSKAYV